MVSEPALQSLTIQAFDNQIRTRAGIARYVYITAGSTSDGPSGHLIYPMLHELDITNLYCSKSELATMLLALPSVTHISLRGNQAEILGASPCPPPNLDSLTLVYHFDLDEISYRRAEAGYRVKTVGLTYFRSAGADVDLPGVQIKVNV